MSSMDAFHAGFFINGMPEPQPHTKDQPLDPLSAFYRALPPEETDIAPESPAKNEPPITEELLRSRPLGTPLCAANWHTKSGSANSLSVLLGSNMHFAAGFVPAKRRKKPHRPANEKWDGSVVTRVRSASGVRGVMKPKSKKRRLVRSGSLRESSLPSLMPSPQRGGHVRAGSRQSSSAGGQYSFMEKSNVPELSVGSTPSAAPEPELARLLLARESAVEALREVQLASASSVVSKESRGMATRRALKLLETLDHLRMLGVKIVERVVRWRAELEADTGTGGDDRDMRRNGKHTEQRRRIRHGLPMPLDDDLGDDVRLPPPVFEWPRGTNYLLKMITDMDGFEEEDACSLSGVLGIPMRQNPFALPLNLPELRYRLRQAAERKGEAAPRLLSGGRVECWRVLDRPSVFEMRAYEASLVLLDEETLNSSHNFLETALITSSSTIHCGRWIWNHRTSSLEFQPSPMSDLSLSIIVDDNDEEASLRGGLESAMPVYLNSSSPPRSYKEPLVGISDVWETEAAARAREEQEATQREDTTRRELFLECVAAVKALHYSSGGGGFLKPAGILARAEQAEAMARASAELSGITDEEKDESLLIVKGSGRRQTPDFRWNDMEDSATAASATRASATRTAETQLFQRTGATHLMPLTPFVRASALRLMDTTINDRASEAIRECDSKRKYFWAINVVQRTIVRFAYLRRSARKKGAVTIQAFIRTAIAKRIAIERRVALEDERTMTQTKAWVTTAHAAAILSETTVRRYLATLGVQRMRETRASTRLQAWFRGTHPRRERRRFTAARVLQCKARSIRAKVAATERRLQRKRNLAAVQLQRIVRGILGKYEYERRRALVAATRIQALHRGNIDRARYRREAGARTLQRVYRGYVVRLSEWVRRLRADCASRLVRWFRRVASRESFLLERLLPTAFVLQEQALHRRILHGEKRVEWIDKMIATRRAAGRVRKIKRAYGKPGAMALRRLAIKKMLDNLEWISQPSKGIAGAKLLEERRAMIAKLDLLRSKRDSIVGLVRDRLRLERQLTRWVRCMDGGRCDAVPLTSSLLPLREAVAFARRAEAHAKATILFREESRESEALAAQARRQRVAYLSQAKEWTETLRSSFERRSVVGAIQRIRVKREKAERQRLLDIERPGMTGEDAYAHKLRKYLSASSTEIAEVRSAFDEFDKDGSGAIDERELQGLAYDMGVTLSGARTKELLAKMDLDGGGTVDFVEFAVWWLCEADSEDALGAGVSVLALKAKLRLKQQGRAAQKAIRDAGKNTRQGLNNARTRLRRARMTKAQLAHEDHIAAVRKETKEFKDKKDAEREARSHDMQVEIAKKEAQRLRREEEQEKLAKSAEDDKVRQALRKERERAALAKLQREKEAREKAERDAEMELERKETERIDAEAQAKKDAEMAELKKRDRGAYKAKLEAEAKAKRDAEQMRKQASQDAVRAKMDAAFSASSEETKAKKAQDAIAAKKKEEKERQRRMKRAQRRAGAGRK